MATRTSEQSQSEEQSELDIYLPGMPSLSAAPGWFERFLGDLLY